MAKSDLKIIFMGTPQIAATVLLGIIDAGYQIASVVTRPDKAQGRSDVLQKSPVKALAEKKKITVFQPENKVELEEHIKKEAPDLVVVAAFGMIITGATIAVPKHGILNVHPSLLPRYRGPWPIGAPILAGDQKTGTTIMLMSEGMDKGDILAQIEYPLEGAETTPELTNTLATISTKLLLETIPQWIAKEIKPQKQKNSEASYTRMENKADGKINWEIQTAAEIERMSRAYTPWPGIYTFFNGKKLDLFDIFVKENQLDPGLAKEIDGEIAIGTKKGSVSPASVQLEGKSKIPTMDFVRGRPNFNNTKLG